MIYASVFKIIVDKLIAIVGLFVLSPILAIIILLLLISNKGNSFFFQKRPGRNGVIFRLVKFKTMSDRKNENGMLLPDEERLTGIGKFVRKTSLDELPQLFNVIAGDMSLVGPRPLLVEYLPLYNKEQSRRHDVKPGITGWAQINGRNTISWKKKFEFDVWYVDHVSFWLDLKILFLTIKKVFVSEGISSDTSVTMEKFTGN